MVHPMRAVRARLFVSAGQYLIVGDPDHVPVPERRPPA